MTIKEVTPDQYAALPLKHTHVFNTAAFSRLNAAKAERLHFLVFEEEGKPRYGITLGEREGVASVALFGTFRRLLLLQDTAY